MKNNIVIISNIIIEPYLYAYMTKISSASNTELICTLYEDFDEGCKTLQSADMIVVLLDFNALYPDVASGIFEDNSDVLIVDAIQKCQTIYVKIKNSSNAHIIWFGFEDYCYNNSFICGAVRMLNGAVDKLNQELASMLVSDVYIDFKYLIAKVGINSAYNPKGKYRWNAPYSKELTELICQEICKQYLIHNGQTKKCIILDCDNVLWGGILSEDGIEKIHLGSGLGQSYQDFQRFLLTLYYHGVILTICSKNDEADVLRVFREHSGMILKEEHIACFKVNWNNKPDNIREIANELEIGLDSMVFIDDSEFEIHSVETMIPEVIAVQYERDSVYGKLSCFNLKSHIDIQQVQKRNQTYRTNVSRQKIKLQSASYDEYIAALEMKIDIHKALSTELSRISELSQRTNKCTNGTRYTVEKLQEQLCTGTYKLYAVYVSDKFSNLGLVGAIGIQKNEVDLFSLSCRALGRSVEEQMLEFIKKQQVSKFSFVTTHKNRDLYNKIKTF